MYIPLNSIFLYTKWIFFLGVHYTDLLNWWHVHMSWGSFLSGLNELYWQYFFTTFLGWMRSDFLPFFRGRVSIDTGSGILNNWIPYKMKATLNELHFLSLKATGISLVQESSLKGEYFSASKWTVPKLGNGCSQRRLIVNQTWWLQNWH